MTNDLIPYRYVIKESEIISIKKNSNSLTEFIIELRELNPKCEYGFNFVSKPIFNETYDLVLIETAYDCGSKLCGGGTTVIYKYVNKNWIEFKVLNTWLN